MASGEPALTTGGKESRRGAVNELQGRFLIARRRNELTDLEEIQHLPDGGQRMNRATSRRCG